MKKLKTRDLIAIGIYNAVFFVLFMASGMLLGMIPITYLFFYFVAGLLLAPVYLLLVVKVRKKGTLFISGIIQAGIWVLFGFVHVPIIVLIGSIISELILSRGNYEDIKSMRLSFIVFMSAYYISSFAPVFLFSDWYMELSTGMGSSPEYIQGIIDLIQGPLGFVSIAVSLIGIIIGSFTGTKFLDKHFKKAGLL